MFMTDRQKRNEENEAVRTGANDWVRQNDSQIEKKEAFPVLPIS